MLSDIFINDVIFNVSVLLVCMKYTSMGAVPTEIRQGYHIQKELELQMFVGHHVDPEKPYLSP